MIERRFKDHGRHEDRLRLFRCSSDCPCGSAVVRWRPDVIEKEACHDAPLKRVAPDVGGPKRRSGEGEGAMGGAGSIGARGGGSTSSCNDMLDDMLEKLDEPDETGSGISSSRSGSGSSGLSAAAPRR